MFPGTKVEKLFDSAILLYPKFYRFNKIHCGKDKIHPYVNVYGNNVSKGTYG